MTWITTHMFPIFGFSTYNSDMHLFAQSQDEDDNTIGPWCYSYFTETFRTQLSFFISVPQNQAQFFACATGRA